MTDALIRKLQGFANLSPEETRAVAQSCEQVVTGRAGDDLIREGDRPGDVFLLIEGWGCRYKLMPDGGRQIMAYLIPGDLCDIHTFLLSRMDHSIGLLSDAIVGSIPKQAMLALLDRHPRLARALLRVTLVDEAILREWLANTLRRPPFERIAHLFCELWLRMGSVGLVQDNSFHLPLTQAELGDTVGVNAVTVNRVLQRLRADGLIAFRHARLSLLDPERLMRVSSFDATYLHLGTTRSRQG